MEKIIKAAVDRGASDIHIKAGDVFRARIDGKLIPLTKQALTPDQTKAIALKIIPNEADRARIDQIRDYDCSWGAGGIGRFRANILKQRSSFMIVLRVIPFEVPTLEKLDLPAGVSEIVSADRGLVLVTGATSSGKSSTLAALINHINTTARKHIITLEHPIEFLHRDLNCSVTQREVGVDTESFSLGLRAALRQDPDVIVIGEMYDAEMVDTVLYGVETGHLILTTLDSPDVESAITRMVTMFPAEEQQVVRHRLASSLRGILSQRLLPRADEAGRAVVAEMMLVTPEIREILADPSRLGELREHMEAGAAEHGLQTFDQHLVELLDGGVITRDVAMAAATDPDSITARARPGKGTRTPKGSAGGAGDTSESPRKGAGAGA
jgi:twitching motility protein PilT